VGTAPTMARRERKEPGKDKSPIPVPGRLAKEGVAMKAFTFLGTNDYKTVTYVWKNKDTEHSWRTHLFPEAVARIFEPEKLIVFVTPQAKEHENFRVLQERLGDLVEPADIPEGKSGKELWALFDQLPSLVNSKDRVLLDITHAFRSIPLIVFAVMAYLRSVKQVRVENSLYGAFEAHEPFRDPPQPEDRAPIFELTLLLDLLDWLSGAEFFLQHSDAALLADRLRRVHREAWQSRASEDLPKELQSVAKKLAFFSQALHLARPSDVMRNAQDLVPMLQEMASEAEQWAKPFALILEQICSEAGKFGHHAPDQLDKENLKKQLEFIEHFTSKGLWVQAILLAREWLVSWTALWRGDGNWLDRGYRDTLANGLGAAAQSFHPSCTESPGATTATPKEPGIPQWFKGVPKSQEVAKLWDWLTQLRNDVAHCGMRKDTKTISTIEDQARKIPSRLKELMDDVPTRRLYGSRVVPDLKSPYSGAAKLDELPDYIERAKELAGQGNEVVLTGQAPVWMYLAIGHALHGTARRLFYHSPVTGEVIIFDHTPR
jgi:CRISPR-associated DxTHG motif protein